MNDSSYFEISEYTYKKINQLKNSMGFSKKSWDDWFDSFLLNHNNDKSDKNVIEQIFRKNAFEDISQIKPQSVM